MNTVFALVRLTRGSTMTTSVMRMRTVIVCASRG